MSNELDFSRRRFLKTTGAVAGAAAVLSIPTLVTESVAADNATHAKSATAAAKPAATKVYRGRMFFTNDLEFSTLSQAAERIFPKDETGPGAIELAVPYFIDNQLAGAFGYNAREYMVGPFGAGAPTQGYQTALLRKDLFQQGLAALNKHSNDTFKMDFPDLTDKQKDQVLKDCEAGKIATDGFTSAYFFTWLKSTVLAGAYADPIYNGNNNMNGWRMKNYPGAQMSYLKIIESKKFEKIEPMSLADMQ